MYRWNIILDVQTDLFIKFRRIKKLKISKTYKFGNGNQKTIILQYQKGEISRTEFIKRNVLVVKNITEICPLLIGV